MFSVNSASSIRNFYVHGEKKRFFCEKTAIIAQINLIHDKKFELTRKIDVKYDNLDFKNKLLIVPIILPFVGHLDSAFAITLLLAVGGTYDATMISLHSKKIRRLDLELEQLNQRMAIEESLT